MTKSKDKKQDKIIKGIEYTSDITSIESYLKFRNEYSFLKRLLLTKEQIIALDYIKKPNLFLSNKEDDILLSKREKDKQVDKVVKVYAEKLIDMSLLEEDKMILKELNRDFFDKILKYKEKIESNKHSSQTKKSSNLN